MRRAIYIESIIGPNGEKTWSADVPVCTDAWTSTSRQRTYFNT